VPGLLIATGHHRNGIPLAPITAVAIESLVTTGNTTSPELPFGLARFQTRRKTPVQSFGETP
jgi:glycine oxidase